MNIFLDSVKYGFDLLGSELLVAHLELSVVVSPIGITSAELHQVLDKLVAVPTAQLHFRLFLHVFKDVLALFF